MGMLLILLIVGFGVIGGVTHASLSARLNSQLNDDLRAAGQGAAAQIESLTGGAPTQAGMPPGAVVAMSVSGHFVVSPFTLDRSARAVRLPDADAARLQSLLAGSDATGPQGFVNVELSTGDYRFQVLSTSVTFQQNGPASRATLMVGIPTAPYARTLSTLDLSMVLVSLGGIVLIGTLGTVLISRALRPLARVSAVASAVAELPLERGDVDVSLRVAERDAQPGTEVGNVGAALNSLLENVDGALEVRAHSEARMRRFAADASHELRTPLAAIQGYSELLGATEALSDDGERSLDRVREQTRRMTELVENLLLLARLDEKRPRAEEPVDLSRLAAELSRDFTVAAPDHEWKLDLTSEEPVVVTGDESQLNRVLANLMSNARKHTSDGTSVAVGVSRTPDGRSALLSVRDTGEGIDPAFIDKVFDRFARADAARSGSLPTTGLGLSIVKAIVESHGGTITVRSVPGDTEFRVTLPLRAADAGGAAAGV